MWTEKCCADMPMLNTLSVHKTEALPQVPQPGRLETTISFAAFATLSVLFHTARLDEDDTPQSVAKPLKDYLKTRYPNTNLEKLKVPKLAFCSIHISPGCSAHIQLQEQSSILWIKA